MRKAEINFIRFHQSEKFVVLILIKISFKNFLTIFILI